jgi:hypothetical protein
MQNEGEEEEKRRPSTGWLPASLRRAYLLSLASLLVFMLVVVEILRQYSQRKGALIHWKYAEDLPEVIWQSYTYLPLVIVLLAIVLLDICAQDVFRLEIYFQLAKQSATPAKVLFTNYCSNGLTASVIAARNRHWIVLCVASTSLIFRMFLPTLVSGIIVLDETLLVEKKVVHTWPSIIDLDTQAAWFTSGIARHGVLGRSDLGSLFLSRPSTCAAAPVSIPIDDENESSLLTLTQTTYWSNLTCVAESQTNTFNGSFSPINSTSGLGSNQQAWLWQMRDFELPGSFERKTTARCQIDLDLEITTQNTDNGNFQARYWAPAYNGTATNSSFVAGDGCSAFGLYGVILDIKIADGNVTASNITTLGCMSVYHQADGDVTLNYNASISDVQIDAEDIKPLDPAAFYVQGFHDLISSKYISPPQSQLSSNFSSSTQSISVVATDQKRFTSDAYLQQLQTFWNEEFIKIVNKLFNPAAGPTAVEAAESSYVIILEVTPNAAIITEAILILSLVVLGMLASVYHRRNNFLQWDPGSIAAQCAIISRMFTPSTKLLLSHTSFRQATTRQLRQWSKGKWVEWIDVSGQPRLCIVDRSQPPPDGLLPPTINKRRDPPPHFLVFPWFLVECLLLMGVLASFGVSLSYLRLKNIDAYATTGGTLTMTFLSYAPTAIASIIGSLITSVYRNLSAMEPWIRLQEGMAVAKESILANRGFRTPYMALTRTRRRKPALLFGISVVCLADLALRVFSGGVYEPQIQVYKSSTSSVINEYNPAVFQSHVNETGVAESIMAASRLMNNVSFLPWASTEYFFVPFSIRSHSTTGDDNDVDAVDEEEDDYDDDDDDSWAIFSAKTLGIGADLDCRAIHPQSGSSTTTQVWNYTLFGELAGSTCTVEIMAETPEKNLNSSLTNHSIRFYAPNGTDGTDTCQTSSLFILASWDRGGVSGSNSSGTDVGSMALQCQPKILIQSFNIQFDSNGMIQDYKPILGTSVINGMLFQNASNSLGLFNKKLSSFSRTMPYHNPTSMHRHDWSGLLATSTYDKLYANTTEIITSHLTSVVQATFRRVFSAHLALWRDRYLEHVSAHDAVPAVATATESLWGLMPSSVLVVIIICLVCVDTAALVVVFLVRFNRYKGVRIPRSIGSLIPWVVDSSFAVDCGDAYDMSEKDRVQFLISQDHRYRLAEFAGETGDQWGLDYDDRHRTPGTELGEMGREL